MGFGVGIGVIGAQILFTLLGIAFFIPGIILVRKGRNPSTKEISSDAEYYGGLVLMILGVILLGGIGLNMFVENLDI
jgi:hypothetical protein